MGAASPENFIIGFIRVYLRTLTQLFPLGWFAGFPNPLLLRSCLSAVFLDLPQVLDSPFGPTIGCSTSCPPRHSVVVQIISALAERRAEEDLSVPGEGKSRPSQTAATSNDLLLAWCDGRSCGRNDQIQKNLSLKKSKK